jgi:hypothetical protein
MVCNEGPSPILNWVPLSIIRAGQGVGGDARHFHLMRVATGWITVPPELKVRG